MKLCILLVVTILGLVTAGPALIREQKPLEPKDPEPVAILLDVADEGAQHADEGVREVRHFLAPSFPQIYQPWGYNMNNYNYKYRYNYGFTYGQPYGPVWF